jgi:hypothetical protein
MNPGNDPLAALRPLHVPDPVGWWPPAPGWWLLAGLLLVTPGVVWWYHRRFALRRAALTELRELVRLEPDDTRLSAGVNQLLRRVALACFPRSQVAGLSGEAWLRFLDSNSRDKGFCHGPGQVLATGPFAPACTLDRAALIDLARRWIQINTRKGS